MATPWPPWNRAPTAANHLAKPPRLPNPARLSAGTASSKPKALCTTSKSKSVPRHLLIPTPPSLPISPNPHPPSTPLATPRLHGASFGSRVSPKPPSRKPPMAFTSSCAPFPTPAASVPVYASVPSSTPILPAKFSPKLSPVTPVLNISIRSSAPPYPFPQFTLDFFHARSTMSVGISGFNPSQVSVSFPVLHHNAAKELVSPCATVFLP